MLFNSYIFLFVFLPLAYFSYRVCIKYRALEVSLGVLLCASLVFYSYWNPPFVLLIIASILFNYSVVRLMHRFSRYKRALLLLGVVCNIVPIAYFKYYGFAIDSFNQVFKTDIFIPSLFLPLGISFFSFQQISYIIDSYKGLTDEPKLLHYALVVCFFPHLIAGPILIYREILPQLVTARTFALSWRNIAAGLALFSLGLFKKVVIADSLSPIAKQVFDASPGWTMGEAWMGALAYTFQIYFDFSGYSDMAIGLGKLFNLSLPVNFNSPYKSLSIIDFWRRWHITLSRFLREYIYIPLGGNRYGETRRYVNLLLTMLIGGFWHGAGWTFVFWGGAHGVMLSINHAWRKLVPEGFSLPKPVAWAITFTGVVFCWVLFRAHSLVQAVEIAKTMAGLNGFHLGAVPGDRAALLALLLVLVLKLPENWQWVDFTPGKRTRNRLLVCAVLLFISVILISKQSSEFLYFQF